MCENKNIMTDITTRNLAFILVFKIFLVIGLFAHINLKRGKKLYTTDLPLEQPRHITGYNRTRWTNFQLGTFSTWDIIVDNLTKSLCTGSLAVECFDQIRVRMKKRERCDRAQLSGNISNPVLPAVEVSCCTVSSRHSLCRVGFPLSPTEF